MRVFIVTAAHLHTEVYSSFPAAFSAFCSYAGMTAHTEQGVKDMLWDKVKDGVEISFSMTYPNSTHTYFLESTDVIN